MTKNKLKRSNDSFEILYKGRQNTGARSVTREFCINAT